MKHSLFNRALALILCAVLLVGYLPSVSADEISAGTEAEIPDGLRYSVIAEEVTVTGYTGTADELTIPAYIEGYPVRYIATDAFWGNDTLTGIVLPDTLTEIGESAFCMCENLIYAQIPSGVSIGSWAFAWCNALEEISLPEDLTSIGESAFYDCSSLTEIVIPDGVTAIPEGLFEDCISLVSVTLPEDGERIGAAAFAGCSSLETLTIPANVLSIAMESQEMVFERCSSLKYIYVHDANTSYSSDASGVLFNKEKTQLLLCPAGKTGTYTLPQTVSTIREKAFEGSALTQIILPEVLGDIGAYAFAGSSLTTITIPKNVVTLGWDRFERCSNLASIWVSEENENFSSDEYGVLFNKDKTTLIRMPSAFEGPYSAPEGLLYVGEKAFAECNGPTEVVLPEGLLGIGGYAFYGSPSLTYVTLPASITDIGDAYENLFVFTDSPNLIARCVLGSYSANWVASEGVPYEYVDGIASVSIATLPAKLTYPVGGELQLDGLTLDAVTDNGLSTITVTNGFTADPVDMDTPGEKTVRVWWSNCSATFTITVDASLVIYMESDHPYAANTDESWGYVHNTDAEQLLITFSEDTETEEGWDFIFIYDAYGNQVGQYSGTALAGQTVTVSGNSFSIRLISDDGICYNGFTVTNIEAIGTGTDTEPTEPVTGCTHDNCQWTVTAAPTFTAVGQQQAVCPDCGETVTQEIPCLEGRVDQWNVSLQDDLQVNFHLVISESIASTAKVRISVGDEAATCWASELEKTEDGKYIATVNIAAAQMAEDILVVVTSGDSASNTYTYTVRQYADTVLADESLSDYHAMVKEMLNYGAAAQAYFDYDADMAANEGITDVGITEVPETAEQDLSVTGNTAAVSFYAASLLYRDKITLRLYFKCAEDGYTFAVNNEPCQVTHRDGYYFVDVAGITPENLDRQVEVDVTGSNDEYLGVVYSPMNYMVRMNAKGSDELKALLKALYNYHLAAKALRTT